ncbi:hypothetical protein PR202_gn00718 [Eleusine coracana subsp. coracana]|uniref:DNA-(apurinic or apyrimidinic site) endonuclease n=1 Tax=Eleusine coracana subsp. coracana TaxID=191504 RepID=A0AAV5G4W3_ELECO|nr:hypothetical protein PR202_gn00718 [Eleusine coracana subsp. coracana]
MKRFFQPVPKEGSAAKKRPAAVTYSGNATGAAGDGDGEGKPGEEPRKFLTWNANSLLLRMKNDWPAFSKFVARLDPDVICIQASNPGSIRKRPLAIRLLLELYVTFSPQSNLNPILEFKSSSHEEIDVSHPDFLSSAKLNGYTPLNKEDCGQPGFTLSERRRFGNILSQGKLVDAYRHLHKEKDMDCGFSWSGHPIGKYRGKRMRIDYFIVSEPLKERIVSCEMHGRGIELEGMKLKILPIQHSWQSQYFYLDGNSTDIIVRENLPRKLKGFYGSDHCPVSLELSKMEAEVPESKASI